MQEDNNAIETSIDSGICDDLTSPTTAEKADNKMKTFEQILLVLERDKLLRAEQRKRLSQLTERRQRKKRVEEPCNVCCIDLDGDNIKSVKCVNCQKIACRGQSCSIWIPSQSGWECQLCNQSQESISKSSEWLHQQITGRYLSPFSARSEPSLLRNHHSPIPDVDRRSDVASSFYGEQKERVREMIEETLGEMLGGSLDNISVNQLYKSRQYLPTWENGEAPGMSHIKLKRFIEKIINDAIRLPNFTNEPTTPGPITDQDLPFFDPKKYQELLATAVLNKIVDSYNYEQKFENNNKDAATDCSDLDTNHNALISRKVQSGSISSSSIEPESDCSITDPPSHASRLEDLSRSSSAANQFTEAFGRYDRNSSSMLTDYLNKHSVPLPDFSIESDSSNEDNLSASKNVGPSWEGNWLFKKKRPGHESPAPIGMLVPSPKEDIKTQIGDKTADELSDLSEAGSECGDNNVDEIEDNAPNALIQNRNIIGGKSPIGLFDELLEQTSLISSSSIPEGDSAYTETKNDYVLGDDLNHDLVKSTKSFIAEEAINSLVDTQTLQNNLSKSKENDKQTPIKANLQELPKPRPRSAQKAAVYLSTKEIPESELTSSSTASSGSIAEREHKKWYNAVEMPNNPYSREALKRRLSTTSDKPMDIPNINSPLEKATSEDKLGRTATEDETIIEAPKVDYKRYGRDYYINDAKCASGSSKLKLSSSVSMHGLNVRDDKSLDKEVTKDPKDNSYWHIPSTIRRTGSLRSVRSYTINDSSDEGPTNPFRRRRRVMPTFDIPSKELAQFEKQLLYQDLKRNSFRARSATKEFVLNPIFDTEHLLESNNNTNQNNNNNNSDSSANQNSDHHYENFVVRNQERGGSVEADSGVDSFSSLSTCYEPRYEPHFKEMMRRNLKLKSSIKRSGSLQLGDLVNLW